MAAFTGEKVYEQREDGKIVGQEEVMEPAKKRGSGTQAFAAFVVLLITGTGGYALFWSVSQIALSEQSRHWPNTTGWVTQSDAVVSRSHSNNVWPEVNYEYRVNGTTYRNSVIRFGQNGSARAEDTEATIAKFRIAQRVTVYYKPTAPQVSCLEPGNLYWETYLALPIGLLFSLFGLDCGLFFFTSTRLRLKRHSKNK